MIAKDLVAVTTGIDQSLAGSTQSESQIRDRHMVRLHQRATLSVPFIIATVLKFAFTAAPIAFMLYSAITADIADNSEQTFFDSESQQ